MVEPATQHRIVYLDHDPWAMPSDAEEDLYPDHNAESDDSDGGDELNNGENDLLTKFLIVYHVS